MKVDVIQTSFAGGEFGPSLLGRTDIAQYANACSIVQNMVPRSYGSVISMPGTRYVATVSDSTLNTRLVKFVFNRTDAYVIEMGDLYMRFFTDRGQVNATSGAGTEDLSGVTAPIAHWKMNDNTNSTVVLDAIGSHNGTVATGVNTATISTTGIVSTCFNIGGSNYVAVADHADFTRTASTQPMSIAGWFYYSSNGSEQDMVTKRDGAATEYDLYVNSTGFIEFRLWGAVSGAAKYTVTTPLATGWHFIVVTFAGDGLLAADCNIYDNAVLTTISYVLGAGYTKMQNTTARLKIGSGGNGPWANKIDNVAFFHVALTPAEISSLYIEAAYQITTVFAANELDDIQYTQLNDIIWLTHPNHPPQKLVRTSAAEWTISDAPIVGGPFLDENTPAITSSGYTASTITITPSATLGTINLTVSPTGSSLFTVSGSTLGHHGSYWMIGGLSLTNATTGIQENGYVRITYVTNSYTATATVLKSLKAAVATTRWAEGAWSSVRGYPSRVTFHERRLWFARTNYEPQTEWGSRIFQYEDFALDTELEDDGLSLPLASTQSNEIQWLAPGRALIAGTYGGAFITKSGADDVITPDNATASEEVGIGSEAIMPKKVGNFLYYVQRFGQKIREMFYNWEIDTYKAVDKNILAPHILNEGVIDMDAQQNPETMLYCILEDGTMATMTREVDQELTAWAKHTTSGTYTSIAIIPSQTASYDEAWVIVERWINGVQKKYVEFFENLAVPDRQDQCLYLHSALTYDAYEATTTSSVTISLSASSGSVTLTSSGAYFAGNHVSRKIRAIDADGNTLGEGTITATASTTSLTLSITTTFNALAYASGRWGLSIRSAGGLSHLEAKTVGILADGMVDSLTKTVASATVSLTTTAFVVNVGLPYDQILYTLPKEAGSQRGTSQGKLQRISEIGLKLNRSTQHIKYGPDANNLDDINLAITPTVNTLYTGVLPPQGGAIAMRGGYSRGAKVYIKNQNPLPLEVLSIMGQLDVQDK